VLTELSAGKNNEETFVDATPQARQLQEEACIAGAPKEKFGTSSEVVVVLVVIVAVAAAAAEVLFLG
jgi:hypothetical protein